MTETLAHGYSSESTQWELSYEYQHDMVIQNLWILVLWMQVALALEGLKYAMQAEGEFLIWFWSKYFPHLFSMKRMLWPERFQQNSEGVVGATGMNGFKCPFHFFRWFCFVFIKQRILALLWSGGIQFTVKRCYVYMEGMFLFWFVSGWLQ